MTKTTTVALAVALTAVTALAACGSSEPRTLDAVADDMLDIGKQFEGDGDGFAALEKIGPQRIAAAMDDTASLWAEAATITGDDVYTACADVSHEIAAAVRTMGLAGLMTAMDDADTMPDCEQALLDATGIDVSGDAATEAKPETSAPAVTEAPADEPAAPAETPTTIAAAPTTVESEVIPLPVNPRGILGGDANPNLPNGDVGELSIIQTGPVERVSGVDSASVLVALRNMTDETVSNLKVSGSARSGGQLIGSGESQGFGPEIVEPGEVSFGYVYFDTAIPEDAEFDLTATSDTYDPDSVFGSVDLAVTEVNLVPDGSRANIVGAVTNQTERPVSGPMSVSVYCFKGDKYISEPSGGFVDGPDPLAPGAQGTFSAPMSDAPCPSFLVAVSGYNG
jgi:hypothetical protein